MLTNGYSDSLGLVDMNHGGYTTSSVPGASGSTYTQPLFSQSSPTQPASGLLDSGGQPTAGLFGVGARPANYDITGAINSVPTFDFSGQVGGYSRVAPTAQNNSLQALLDLFSPKKKPSDDDDSGELVRRSGGGKTLASSKLSSAAKEKIKDVAAKINCDPDDLIAVMKAESGCKTTAVNPNGGATGLIQFMPSTAKDLGTTCKEIGKKSDFEQVVLAGKYLEKAKKLAKMSADEKLDKKTLHALIFMPANAKKDVLCEAGSKEYAANKSLDKNGKGYISKDDLG